MPWFPRPIPASITRWRPKPFRPRRAEGLPPALADPAKVTVPPYYPDHPVTRREWARYLDSVSGLDHRFGRVLAKLEADGLADNTVVVFFADNGRLEARGIHWCYDSGLHVPLIVRWPKGVPAPPQYRPGGTSANS